MTRCSSVSDTAALSSPSLAAPRALSAGLLLVIVVVAFESVSVSTIMPRIAAELHGLNLYGWASSAFLLSSLPGAVLTGLLADRRGVVWGAALSLLFFGVGVLLVGFAPNMSVLVLGRLIEGVGVGGLNALPFVVIGLVYQGDAQARMLAAISTMWLIPGLAGPYLASTLAEHLSWRAVLWGLAGLLVLAAPLCLLPLRHLPAAPGTAQPKRMLWPALGLMLSAAALVEGLRQATPISLLVALLGAGGIVLSARPLFPAGMWRLYPGLPSALVVRGFMAFAMMGSSPFLTLALQKLHGLSLREAGWMISIGGLSWTMGAWLQVRIERQFGSASRLARVRFGAVGLSAGLLLTVLGLLGGLPVWTAFLGWLIGGIGMGVGYNSTSLYALSSAGEGQSGQLSGQLANIEVLMVALATGISGALIARVTPLEHALLLAFGLNLLASLVPWLAVRRLREP